jgi:hypothetical protein
MKCVSVGGPRANGCAMAAISEARCADLILIEKGKSSGDIYRSVDVGAAIL